MCDHNEIDGLREWIKKQEAYIAELESTIDYVLFQFERVSPDSARLEQADERVGQTRKNKP